MPIKLLIVDDQRLIRQCFERVLASDPEIEIVGSAMDGTEAVLRGVECQPDVVLMDFSMPGMNGVEATRMLHERVPRAKVLILSMHGQGHQVSRAMREGIAGYIVKDVPAGELIRIIKAVHHGERVESAYLVDRIVGRGRRAMREKLTNRQARLLRGVWEGRTNADLADRFFVSEQTVKRDLMELFQKLGVKNRTEAAIRALELGLVDPSVPDSRGAPRAQ
jgi:DNA-binding NarL/FixJ family response regulator